ncbi:MAG: hypothetical protein ACI823_002219, partial [Chitinophagales bacterium]
QTLSTGYGWLENSGQTPWLQVNKNWTAVGIKEIFASL